VGGDDPSLPLYGPAKQGQAPLAKGLREAVGIDQQALLRLEICGRR